MVIYNKVRSDIYKFDDDYLTARRLWCSQKHKKIFRTIIIKFEFRFQSSLENVFQKPEVINNSCVIVAFIFPIIKNN